MPPADPLTEIALALGHWPMIRWLREELWAYPAVSGLHVLGIGLLLGSIVALDARLLGLRREIPIQHVARAVWPFSVAGVALAILTGVLLFLVQPVDYLVNPAFLWKFVLLMLALVNVALFHASFPGVLAGYRPVTRAVRVVAGVSLLLWLAVLIAGRLIAFV